MVVRSTRFDVATGDLDGDGTSEIILVAGAELNCGESQGCWQVIIKVYDYDNASYQRFLATKPWLKE